MRFIHHIIPTTLFYEEDPFYCSWPKEEIDRYVARKPVRAVPVRVYEDTSADAEYPSGHRVWSLPGDGLFFTTFTQAVRVFTDLHGRTPDPGLEIRAVNLEPYRPPVEYPWEGEKDQTERDAIQADYQAEQRETDYYGSSEHAAFGDAWYYRDCPGAW